MSDRTRPQILRVAPSLMALARAAEHECSTGHAKALRALSSVAATKVPSRGVLWSPGDSDEQELYLVIELIAQRYLGAAAADAAWRRSLDAIAPKTTFEEFNDVEGAYLHCRWISQTVHFYAGLAFGVTFADWGF
jgi:hypothetical protein